MKNTALLDLINQGLLSGQYDRENAILSIHAGAGGTEAQDWAQMLQRMFIRWADTHEFKITIMTYSQGDFAGIKSCFVELQGNYVYGRLKSEIGVHRLVRISPYDFNSRRHTSFAKVNVYPIVDIEIDQRDLQFDFSTANGAGGQSLRNQNPSVRITHLPSGNVFSCNTRRSLIQNTNTAMKILKSQLFCIERRKQEATISALKGEGVGWNSQIRSYVLHPYKMVKDHRTKEESENPTAVLDGDLDKFINAYLMHAVEIKQVV